MKKMLERLGACIIVCSLVGSRVQATLASFTRLTASLFYLEPIPGSARITVVFDSTGVLDGAGQALDADGDGQPGGIKVFSFETLSTTAVPNTAAIGKVMASELAPTSPGNKPGNQPLSGVIITVDG